MKVEALNIEDIYPGKIVALKEFGAFVELVGISIDGLIMENEITDNQVKNVADYLRKGMEVQVMLINKDPSGKNRFSIKQAHSSKGLPQLSKLD